MHIQNKNKKKKHSYNDCGFFNHQNNTPNIANLNF